MATYANATNPFIEPDNKQSQAAGEQQLIDFNNNNNNNNLIGTTQLVVKKNKNAPGMARLQSNNHSQVAGGSSRREKRRAAAAAAAAAKKRADNEADNEANELINISQMGKDTDTTSSKTKQQNSTTTDATDNNCCSLETGCENKLPLTPSSSIEGIIELAPPTVDDSIISSETGQVIDGNGVVGGCEHNAKVETSAERPESSSVCNREPISERTLNDSQISGGLIELSQEVASIDLDKISEKGSSTDIELSAFKVDTNDSALNNGVNIAIKNIDDDEGDDAVDEDDDETLGAGLDTNNSINANQDERAPMEQDSRRHQHIELIRKLRLQLRDLERYAYERGELEQVPPSILAERQSVILDMLKKKLPLNIDKDRIEKLELEELKCQVDKEISDLIDPLITKDHLLNQLKTQLTDLERYISHLHETLGKSYDKNRKLSDCSCPLHGCTSPRSLVTFKSLNDDDDDDHKQGPSAGERSSSTSMLSEETLPKTSRLIRGLMAQLICSDIKIQEAMKMDKDFGKFPGQSSSSDHRNSPSSPMQCTNNNNNNNSNCYIITKAPQFHDGAVWTMHIDKVLLATDSLTNLFAIEPSEANKSVSVVKQSQVDEALVESIVRRQLVPAIRDLLAYGLIDPNLAPRTTYRSFLFDPYYLISSLTCLPGSQSSSELDSSLKIDKIHIWNVIEDYFKSRIEPEFMNSSVKSLSQSFNLTPSMNGPIKVTSKQALLIAVDDIVERLARCRPNGPESHFKLFVYMALNQAKLATWIRIIFKNKSILRKYYHNFSFTNQSEKMDKFLLVIEALSQIEFKLNIDTESAYQFVSAF